MATIIKGYNTIVADPQHLYKYICKTEKVDEKFYPTKDMNKDKKKTIDQILEWIHSMLKRNINRLVKFKLQKILLDKKMISNSEACYNKEEEEKEREIFFNICLVNLE